jgi:vitamin B12 transporter
MDCTSLAPGAEIARRSRRHRLLVSLPLAAAALLRAPFAAAETYESVVIAPPPAPERPREDLTASASVITADRTPRSAETVPQLLSEQPGVAITRYGAHGSLATISLRGSAPNQVSVYVDGVPLGSALTGSVDAGLLPLTGADRIEIYRGQSPLAFGSSAIGGVVAITSEAPTASGLAAHGGAGSFGTRYAGGEAAYAGGRLTLLARLSLFGSTADFPYTNDGGTLYDATDDRDVRRDNNQLRQRDGLVRMGLALTARRRLLAVLSLLDRHQGLPNRGTEESFSATLDHRRLLFSTTFEDAGATGAGNRLRATAYALLSEQRLDDRLREIAFRATSSRDRSTAFGLTTVAEKRLAWGLRLAAMLDGRHEAFWPHETLRAETRPAGRRELGAAGPSASFRFARVPLELGASGRVELASEIKSRTDALGAGQPAGHSERYVLPIARLGAVLEPAPALRVRANAGRYARLPSLYELYGNGGRIVGNADLAPESGLNADVGATYTRGAGANSLTLDGALFAAWASELIDFRSGSYFARYENVGHARPMGAELSVTARALSYLRLFAQGTFTDARDTTGFSGRDGNQLPHRPRLRAYARPELRGLPLGRNLTVGLYADLDVTSGRYQDAANLVEMPARALFGAGGYVALPRAGVRVLGSAYNLGNSRTDDVLEYPLPGRSVFLTLELAYPSQTIVKETAE